ncbi:putative oxidoreductase, 2OG-Fe(II) oxygenase family [Aspergillus clavatus NRRL 1]|uniref:Isopenicillin N synthase-like Fe(2+) 2OG dioxygenase domain-containing protein n=1 Tax=Aspergillus clavatus (strain ATCC 1007 / CBS 513.65 / DSM 816 / NCTC 3887 / NRRL 1 / QM 1276 / 107) TaxID=344612 RepID=A1C7B0_ASPCL|nr:uncharacterized protein ACLA_073160 [Aspergillus clavatus NRRL 1]EAW14281.1 hypothetical protein ACLA_073160 [Aspergillus clavatus NRRL 1]
MAFSANLQQTVIDGHRVLHAPLQTISYSLLARGDPREIEKLVRNSKSPGFFYLDLRADQRYLDTLPVLYQLAEEYFAQPEEVKMIDFRGDQERGYKPGEAETFEIARDEILQGTQIAPQCMSKQWPLVEDFLASSHETVFTVLSALSRALDSDRLEDSHREGQPSDSGLKLESVPFEEKLEDVPPSEHTDGGTLTLLFCPHYTTEIQMPGSTEWGFIEPKTGHAIVNVANSLQRLSKGELHSRVHRVGQPVPGAGKRFCLLYYLRPESALNLFS